MPSKVFEELLKGSRVYEIFSPEGIVLQSDLLDSIN